MGLGSSRRTSSRSLARSVGAASTRHAIDVRRSAAPSEGLDLVVRMDEVRAVP
jgi:hypothetical protein